MNIKYPFFIIIIIISNWNVSSVHSGVHRMKSMKAWRFPPRALRGQRLQLIFDRWTAFNFISVALPDVSTLLHTHWSVTPPRDTRLTPAALWYCSISEPHRTSERSICSQAGLKAPVWTVASSSSHLFKFHTLSLFQDDLFRISPLQLRVFSQPFCPKRASFTDTSLT